MAVWVFVMGLIVFIVVAVFWLRFDKKCPKCGRAHAIESVDLCQFILMSS